MYLRSMRIDVLYEMCGGLISGVSTQYAYGHGVYVWPYRS
jgi:hypothetical protein